MKGFFLVALLILGVSLIPLTAATSAGSGDENLSENGMGSAGVNINFDLSSEDNSSWEIGFTDNVEGLKNNGTIVTPLASEDVALKIGEGTSGTLKENLYVYWIIKGGQQLEITLEADGALKEVAESGGAAEVSEDDSAYMNWKIEWDSSSSGSEEKAEQTLGDTELYENNPYIDYQTASPVFTRTNPDKSLETGFTQLFITTQDITDVAPVNYSANLTLKITPVETT